MTGAAIEFTGTIREEHARGHYVVACRMGEHVRRVHVRASRKLVEQLMLDHSRLAVGDIVAVELFAGSTTRGRIVERRTERP